MWGVYDRMMHFNSINVQGLIKKDQDQIPISRYITLYKDMALINMSQQPAASADIFTIQTFALLECYIV